MIFPKIHRPYGYLSKLYMRVSLLENLVAVCFYLNVHAAIFIAFALAD